MDNDVRFGPNHEAVMEGIRLFENMGTAPRTLLSSLAMSDSSQVTYESYITVYTLFLAQPWSADLEEYCRDYGLDHWMKTHLVAAAMQGKAKPEDIAKITAPITFFAETPAWANDEKYMGMFLEAVPNLGMIDAINMVDNVYRMPE